LRDAGIVAKSNFVTIRVAKRAFCHFYIGVGCNVTKVVNDGIKAL
jgi:hypothetical protein